MPTLLAYRNDREKRFCEIVFDDGERIAVEVAANGLAIDLLADGGRPGETLFRASPAIASRICAALTYPASAGEMTPLDIVVAAVTALGSAEKVGRAFRDAAVKAGG